jgi:hypothetical protein
VCARLGQPCTTPPAANKESKKRATRHIRTRQRLDSWHCSKNASSDACSKPAAPHGHTRSNNTVGPWALFGRHDGPSPRTQTNTQTREHTLIHLPAVSLSLSPSLGSRRRRPVSRPRSYHAALMTVFVRMLDMHTNTTEAINNAA